MTGSGRLMWSLALGFSLVLTGCSGKTEEKPVATADSSPLYTVTGDEGSITGSIAFNSPSPAPKKIQMDSDPVCARNGANAVSEEIVVKDGHLANVFVYVKSGLPKNSFPVPTTEVVLDQQGCRYVPHVVGLQTNQPLKVMNSDATAHNVHPVPRINREWNESQYPSAPPIVKKFALEEVVIPVKCNQHSWMKASVAVLSHPFFSVSSQDGTFSIKGLPPGQYELIAWHEKLGEKKLQVTVAPKAEAKADFAFEATTTSNFGTLKVQPALIVP
ncbi:MAG: carboxypeptidase regulatory-like domain-containing protein [Acidobacteriota bacterium]